MKRENQAETSTHTRSCTEKKKKKNKKKQNKKKKKKKKKSRWTVNKGY